MEKDKFVVIEQPRDNAEFRIQRVYSETKELIDQMAEMTGEKKARLIHQMVLFCMERLEIKPLGQ